MDDEQVFTGQAILGRIPECRPATIVVRNGVVTHVEEESRAPDRWICPAFFNAHTHLGDTVAIDLPCSGSLIDLVTPPHGLKHRILARTPPCTLIRGMRSSVSDMISSGTAGFAGRGCSRGAVSGGCRVRSLLPPGHPGTGRR